MISFSKMTIKQKVISLIMIISCITLILGSIAFILNDRYTARHTMAYILASQASLVSSNSSAALLFGDQEAIDEIMLNLSEQKHIIATSIFTKYGDIFASFNKHKAHHHLPENEKELQGSGHLIREHTIDIWRPIEVGGDVIGAIYISASLDELYANVINYSSIVAASLLATLGLALLLSSRLQKAITGPIQEILYTTSQVTASNNYSLRINKNSDDELGKVSLGINEMLRQIERRDVQLESYANELEHKVSERTKELELITEQFRHQAYHDELTNLPNRALFLERMNYSISQGKRQGQTHALIFIDLDGFKTINDVLGHDIGDELLVNIAERLSENVRDSDTVSRFGGDEFILLLNHISDTKSVEKMANKILRVLQQPVVCKGREIHLTASLGISMFPGDGDNAIDLLKYADTAMYQAKSRGKNNFQFYIPDFHIESLGRMTTENELRMAISNGELVLHYQPKVNVITKTITGVEILLRWQHPEKGILLPEKFIDVAEDSGLIIPMGQWTLKEACAQSKIWRTAPYQDIGVAMNLSAIQLYQEDLLSTLVTCMENNQAQPWSFQLELTESMVMNDVGRDRQILKDLRDVGISLAIDDFGTGYSCLSQLRNLPVDTIKIDRSFVRDLVTDTKARAVVQAIIGMSEAMKLHVIAEGVESEEQLHPLVAIGCHEFQGYFFSHPVPANELHQAFKDIQKKLENLSLQQDDKQRATP